MHGLGTIINVFAIIVGGLLGMLFGRFIGDRHRDTLCKACGLAVIFIGVAGALNGMFSVSDGKLVYGGDFLIIGCLALGGLVGELINIEGGFEKFGAWLKRKTHSTGDNSFIEGFVNASFTVCIGAMAIVGSINDGLYGDHTVLVTKAILDFIIIMVMVGNLSEKILAMLLAVFLMVTVIQSVICILKAPKIIRACLQKLTMLISKILISF